RRPRLTLELRRLDHAAHRRLRSTRRLAGLLREGVQVGCRGTNLPAEVGDIGSKSDGHAALCHETPPAYSICRYSSAMNSEGQTRDDRQQTAQARNDPNALITGVFGLSVMLLGLYMAATS